MLKRLLLIFFVVIPLIEIFTLVQVGRAIGFWYTLGVVVMFSIVGLIMVRKQGFLVLRQIRKDIAYGIPPGKSLLNGLLILCGGIFLILPGLITDLIGLLLLTPAIRKALIHIIKPSIVNHVTKNTNIYIKRF